MNRSYRDLQVWAKAMGLVQKCYEAARTFPRVEEFGLATQLRRASVSIPSNIAEGQGRIHRKEFLQHLSIAYGSLMEVETHLQIGHRLGYLTTEALEGLMDASAEIGRMLNGLMNSLKRRHRQ